jgi:hypothetical protein
MEWAQLFVLVFGNLAVILPMWLWSRSEARADARRSDEQNIQLRREMIDIMRSMEQENRDFHGRLERQDAEIRGEMKVIHMRIFGVEERHKSK